MSTAIESRPIPRRSADELEAPPLSLRQLAWRRFRRHKMAMFGSVMLILLILYSLGGVLFFTEKYANFNDTALRLAAPSREHPFGTDTIGRDILARTIYGGQISLLIGLTAVALEVFVGVLIGAPAGYFGGKLDSLLMRFTEAMICIPQIFLLIVMAKFFGGKIPNVTILGRDFSGSVVVIVLIIGLTSWPYLARIVRAEFLSLKESEFMLAARAIGTRPRSIISGHILPNSIAPIIVSATLGVANAILPKPTSVFWGWASSRPPPPGATCWRAHTTTLTRRRGCGSFPGMLILLTVLSINFVGDGLRDALDPRSRAV